MSQGYLLWTCKLLLRLVSNFNVLHTVCLTSKAHYCSTQFICDNCLTMPNVEGNKVALTWRPIYQVVTSFVHRTGFGDTFLHALPSQWQPTLPPPGKQLAAHQAGS